MIILPDRNISRSKFLLPVLKKEWMLPSDYTKRDEFGNCGIRTKFHVTARLNDGHIVWDSWFDDREDFDAFLFAAHTGTLKYERALWDLPSFEWHDGIGDNVNYYYAISTVLSATGSGTYTIPSDWNNGRNAIYAIGAGGSGGAAITTTVNAKASGGGGGEYRATENYSVAIGTNVSYTVGAGPVASMITSATSVYSPGGSGGSTNFGSVVIANGGTGGGASSTTANASEGTGGTGGTGAFAANGGAGSGVTFAGSSSGGGGAGTPNALYTTTNPTGTAGSASPAPTATNTNTNGGASGFIGGGTAPGGNGTSGTAGGGGGGSAMSAPNLNATAGYGGIYGGGGGGAAVRSASTTRNATPGYGRQGLIVVSYIPSAVSPFRNMPVLGL